MPRSTRKSKRTAKRGAGARRKAPPRLVLDTNIWISALLWTGPPNTMLRAGEDRKIILLTSPSLVEEAREVLTRPKFLPRIAMLETSVSELVESVLSVAEVIEEPDVEPVVTADPDDDRVLACAVAGEARCIVSGDAHLLKLKHYKRIAILTPTVAVRKLPGVRRQRRKG